MRNSYHYEWTKTLNGKAGTKEEFIEYMEGIRKPFKPEQDWDHRHHNHYDVNLTYQNYRKWQ